MSKLGKKEKRKKKLDYFETFTEQISLATKEAILLKEVIDDFTKASDIETCLPKVHAIENEADQVCHALFDAILSDFVTPIDREDIIELTNRLDDLTDIIEEVIQSFYMYDVHFMHDKAAKFADITLESCKTLKKALDNFGNFKKNHEKIQVELQRVNTLEDEADVLYLDAIRGLYTTDNDNPMRVMVWANIFTTMEDCVDTCESISDLMNAIMLKHG